ncbi:alkylphosphonate utilization protein [Sulfurovum sp. bin170]|uniref:PhnA domain-containing protein n=1 Tax=Sulfurovum sp. bin170 TaxID=2695268 RepID=UPI0013DEC99C|nr:alkylphosphonate utilization protein [Sulfurovum sp. bin170]NEW61216.1 alkylphosphonate utilization protein [Sulfurovum sp. bin170]
MSKDICELCSSPEELRDYEVAPKSESIVICSTCASSIHEPNRNLTHWHCLSESMWSSEPAVQVMAYRILTMLGSQDQLDMMYMEPEVEAWAKQGIKDKNVELVRDSNGTILEEGDSVSVIKDLVVKGAGFTAKQGTTVKNIQMVQDDPTHIQGRVNGTKIFILTKFLKKL